MRSNQIYNEYLYEGLDQSSRRSMRLWEGVAIQLKEAALTPDQIQQIFTSVEQGATAGGANRTIIGKGKDVAVAVNTAWNDLKDKIYNSKPMSNFAAEYDKAAEKLKQATGGDEGAMKYINKYRKFAEEHPILQSAIYAALIAAAGVTGIAPGGAALLGLFKLVDQAIQGKDIRSAAWSGIKTGAAAYGAAKIGQALQGAPKPEIMPYGQNELVGATNPDAAANANIDRIFTNRAQGMQGAVPTGGTDYNSVYSNYLATHPPMTNSAQSILAAKKVAAAVARQATSGQQESIDLSESTIATLFTLVQIKNRQFNEGIWDTIKNKAATVGKNLTTKVTADKLNSAWTAAGSPTDSDAVAQVIQGAGVDPAVVTKAYTDLNIPAPAGKVEPALDQPAAAPTINTKDMFAQIMKLTPAEQQQVLAYLKK